jgi:hypothetical protein
METIVQIVARILRPLFPLGAFGIFFLIIAIIIQEVGKRLLRRRITRLESGSVAATITIVVLLLAVLLSRWQ